MTLQRERYWRRKFDIEADTDLLPANQSRAALLRMHSHGASWELIADMAVTDRRGIQRLALGQRKYVTRNLQARLAAVDEWIARNPAAALAVAGGHFVDSEFPRWMVGTLMAEGWTSGWIGEQVGWQKKMSRHDLRYSKVTRSTAERIEAVFKEYRDIWGPSRQGARRMWRQGVFPAECYDWDTDHPDFRPIPGSLAPELVREAAGFVHRPDRVKTEAVLAAMRGWGQWPDEGCAKAVRNYWASRTGRSIGDSDDVRRCKDPSHQHRRLPEVWRKQDDAQTRSA